MIKYCPRCGYANPDDALFCAGCGYQFPQQPSQPPYIRNNPHPKNRKMAIIRGLKAVVILFIAFIVISPLLLTPTSAALYSPSQASSNFGGSWTLSKNKSMIIYHIGSQYYIKYYNGTTVYETNASLVESYLSYSDQVPCIVYFTTASIEVLNSSYKGQPINLTIKILYYENNSIPSIIYNKSSESITNLVGLFGNVSVFCPNYAGYNSMPNYICDGFNTTYIGIGYDYDYVKGEPGAFLIAIRNNELVMIGLYGEYVGPNQLWNVLSAITTSYNTSTTTSTSTSTSTSTTNSSPSTTSTTSFTPTTSTQGSVVAPPPVVSTASTSNMFPLAISIIVVLVLIVVVLTVIALIVSRRK